MNILWIEDFGGGLDRGKATLNLMFQDLISFDNWDEDELSLLSKPSDLENFFKQNSALHCVFLCRHYFDYAEFKINNELAKSIDVVIIDIRLDNNVDFNLSIPSSSNTKAKFHEEAGFYIFNDLVRLGFPAEKMCFMTGEKNSFSDFKKQCDAIYIPEVVGFEKSDAEYGKFRQWIKERESDYAILRRGIIEGCRYLKPLKESLRFDKFSKDNNKPAFLDVHGYLDVLGNFLPLREPVNKAALYKLFIRTLAHEWEESVKPKKIDLDQTTFAFSWVMKMTRNWMAHNSTAIFTNLTEQDVAYLFICNMRAIFDLGNETKDYEKNLFLLFNKSEESEAFKESELVVKEKRIPLVKHYVSFFNEKTKSITVHNILNDLQNDKAKVKAKGDDFFITGLYHSFWFLTSEHDDKKDKAEENNRNPNQVDISRYYKFYFFDYAQSEFLLKFSSHIYNRSFLSGEK
jgi:hypothetical protein